VGVKELVVVNTKADTGTRQRVEGYLAWKWGMQGNLPAGHPYKASSPAGGSPIANIAPTTISNSAATFNADLDALDDEYDVTVCYGRTDGGTNAGSWETSALVGSFTNVSTNVSYVASGLASGTEYHYTFMASNASGIVWASPSWSFTTPETMAVTESHSVPHAWLDATVPGASSDYEAAVTNDPDGDGFATWQEYWTGTNPNDPDSYFKLDGVRVDGGNVVLEWSHFSPDIRIPDVTIRKTDNLDDGSWSNIGTKTPVNGLNSWSNATGTAGFYSIIITNVP